MTDPLEQILGRMQRQVQESLKAQSLGDQEDWAETALTEVSNLIEELKVAEEELRVQNEELHVERQRVEQERARYFDLFEFAPEAYLVTDLKGMILEANRAAGQLLNSQPLFLLKKPVSLFIHSEDSYRFKVYSDWKRPYEEFELRIIPRKSANPIDAAARISPVRDFSTQKPIAVRWVIRDTSERNRMFKNLQNSEERFRKLFMQAPTGMVQLGSQGEFQLVNPAFLRLSGYSQDELAEMKWVDLLPAHARSMFELVFKQAVSGRGTPRPMEQQFLSKEGRLVWSHINLSRLLSPLDGEKQKSVLLLVEDISMQKRLAAERVEMQRQMIEGIEVERTRLARDLHDRPLQDLYGVVYMLAGLSDRRDDPEDAKKLEELNKLVQGVIDSLRTTTSELRPPSLSHFGIAQGIRSYTNEVEKKYPQMDIHLALEGLDHRLPESTLMVIFRAYQEAINNVARHAEAGRVEVRLYVLDKRVVLEVADDGIGFAVPDNLIDLAADNHFGLIGMFERVNAAGGSLEILSDAESGTTLKVKIPLPE